MNLVCPDKMDKTREDDWCVEVARIIAKRKERLAGVSWRHERCKRPKRTVKCEVVLAVHGHVL